MHIQPNQIISLGYGKFARSDEIISFEPVTENRGAGRRFSPFESRALR